MSDNLRDQLMKSGLASEQQVKQARTDKQRKSQKQPRKKKSERVSKRSEAATFAAQVDAAKRAHDRDLNREREAERERRAEEHAAREILVKNEIKRDRDNEHTFNFTVDGRIKKLNVNAQQRDQLAAGTLAIGRTRGQFRLVAREVAERVRARAPFLIVHCDDGRADDDDPSYAAFPVPDDITW